MADIIQVTDLPSAVQQDSSAALMVAGANGQAERVAPCLFWEGTADSDTPAPSAGQTAEAKLVLLGAIIRWTQQGAGGVQQQVAGPFSVGTFQSQSTGYRLWPSEITQLQDICSDDSGPAIGSIDTAPSLLSGHLPWCDWMFNGGTSCSCGYDIAERPIYENAPGL